MRKLYATITALALSATGLYAQQPLKLSLSECIDYALKNSYTMKNAHIDVLMQQSQVRQTTSAAMPHVNGKIDANHFNIAQKSYLLPGAFPIPGLDPNSKDVIPVAFTIPYTSSASITASQVLFDGSVLVALQAKDIIMDLARKNERVTEEIIRYNIYKAYHALVIAHKQFDLVRNSLTFARSMEQDLEKTRVAGFAEKIDVDRTSVQVNNLATDSLRIYNMLMMSEQMLKFQLGMDIYTPITLTDTNVEASMKNATMLVAEKEDYDRVPEYSALTTLLQVNEYDLKRYRLSALPSIAGVWSYGSNYGAGNGQIGKLFDFEKYNIYSMFGISINAPIFNGFVRQYQVQNAKLNIEKTKNNLDNLKLSINFQAASARTTLKNSLLQVQSQKRNLELANSVLDLAQKKYKAGVGSNLEVTTAQTELLRAQNNYFTALLDVANAEADLKKSLGQLK